MNTALRVVGVIGRDVPLELIDAAGARPRRLIGRPDVDRAFADTVLGRGIDPAGRAMLATLLADRFAGIDAIAACSDNDQSQRLYYALRELARRMPDAGVPPLHIVDVLHLRSRASLAYTQKQLAAFAAALEAWGGREITARRLGDAMRRRDEARDALRAVARRRSARGAAEFIPARRAFDDLPAPEATETIERLSAESSSGRQRPGTPVILTGSADLGSGTAPLLEELGFLVVGDHLPDGEAGLALRAAERSMSGLAERAWRDADTPYRGSSSELAIRTTALAEERGARAIVVVVRRRDEAPLWDVGALRAVSPVPVLALTDQPYGDLDRAARAALGRLRTEAVA